MSIRHIIKKVEKGTQQELARGNIIVGDLLKVLDKHDPPVSETMSILMNMLAFVVLIGVEKEPTE